VIDFPRAFVIGDPVAHSKSPLIHTRWLQTYGIAGSYEAIHVKPEGLSTFMARLRAGEFVGGNVTVPHKVAVMDLCDRLDPDAEAIGAVNTLLRAPDGTIVGSNTDHYGFLANLDERAPAWDSIRNRALVLGAGGAARAVVHALARRGYRDIVILNRTLDKARELADAFPARAAGLEDYAALAPDADFLVNTTTIGMHGTRFAGLPLEALPPHAVVTDIVYTPLVTPLLADAERRGLVSVDGLGMLLHQAVPGFAAWFGKKPAVTPALRSEVIAVMGK